MPACLLQNLGVYIMAPCRSFIHDLSIAPWSFFLPFTVFLYPLNVRKLRKNNYVDQGVAPSTYYMT